MGGLKKLTNGAGVGNGSGSSYEFPYAVITLILIPLRANFSYSRWSVGVSKGIDDLVRYLAKPSTRLGAARRCLGLYAYRLVYG